MPKLSSNAVPAYRLHRQSGQAIVTLSGRDILLGKHATAASRAEYNRVTAEWLAAGRQLPAAAKDATVAELLKQYKAHCETYYRHQEGTPTGEAGNIGMALKPLRLLYWATPAKDFSPLKLKAVRDRMVQAGWCRKSVNRNIGRVRAFFKWAAENELIPASVYHGMTAVSPLKAGRCAAKESDPVQPVADEVIEATLPFLTPTLRGMVQLQRLTGARPGEICSMRIGGIDRAADVWSFTPPQHKNTHHGKGRTIFIGPKAQEVLRSFLMKLDPVACIFSPADSLAEMRERRRGARKTPLSCGNVAGSNVKRKPKRQPGEQFDTTAYCRAVARGAELADRWAHGGMTIADSERIIEHWHPHRLRHSAATDIRRQFGIEAAQHVLGHATLAITELYAEKNADVARKVAAAVG